MSRQRIEVVEAAISFIESHLQEKLNLNIVADAVHYSKYHLHRMFADTVGLAIHDYVKRRQLTEAAKLLVFTDQPVLQIALEAGYESQQAFSDIFKAMYKVTPAQYREWKEFYPLQLPYILKKEISENTFSVSDICLASMDDISDWMKLVRLVVDGYPHLEENFYQDQLKLYIEKRQALLLRDGQTVIGAMLFSYDTGSIDFLGVHPQYRKQGIEKLFLGKLMTELLPGKELSITTFRERDRADTDWREVCKRLGFVEEEFLMEFGYPTQRFVLTHFAKMIDEFC